MVASDLAAAQKQLQAAYDKGDVKVCTTLISQIKLLLTKKGALALADGAITATVDELQLARDVLEQAVIVSVQAQDESMFERNYSQLQNLYATTRTKLQPSPREYLFVGLNLLRLLVENRTAEFHTELELIPVAAQHTPYLQLPIKLEQWLMEGAYNKVLTAQQSAPDASYSRFLQMLSNTVRDEIASCSERAYQSMTLKSARELLMFKNDAELKEYCATQGWSVEKDRITFQAMDAEGAPLQQLASLQLINHSLTYAKELERIV